MLDLNKKNCIKDLSELKSDVSIDNLFVITNFGQMNHVSGLINYLGLNKSFLIVLYTNANLYIPQTIHDGVDENMFEGMYFLEIPKFPNKIDVNLALNFKKKYFKVLSSIKPDYLFINSFQFHYSILATIAKNMGIKIVLVEEGLGTYRLGGIPDEGKIKGLNFSKIKEVSSKSLSKTQVFKKLYKNYKEVKQFANASKQFVVDLYKTQEVQSHIIRLHPDKEIRSVLTPYVNYDYGYTSFPKVSEKIFNILESNFYFSHNNVCIKEINKANEIIEDYGITDKDYIYLSQQYSIDDLEYVRVVTDELLKLVENKTSNIFVKLHPRNERPKVIQAFETAAIESLGRIKVIQESNFRIESVIKQARVEGVVSITSTGLVYTSIISPECKMYSIAEVLISKLDGKKNARGIKMIEEHTKIIKQFDNIIFL